MFNLMDTTFQGAVVLVLLPGLAIIGISLNLLMRARGGRSFSLKVKAFGVDIMLETHSNKMSPIREERNEVE